MTSRIARMVAVAAMASGALAAAPAAMAQTPDPAASTAQSSCVLYAGSDTVHCFDSSAEEATYEHSGRMESWVVVGYFYYAARYGGTSKLTVKAPTGCDADTRTPDWSWSKITPSWNNRVRSFVTRNQCDLMGYDGYNYTGEHFVRYTDHDDYMPYWGGRISSLRMS